MRRIFISLFLFVSVLPFPENIKRFVGFIIVSDISGQMAQFTVQQFVCSTRVHCTQLCFVTQSCLTFKFRSQTCTLYSYDPRIKNGSLENSMATAQSSIYGKSQTEDKMACFADQSEVSNRSEIEEKCDLGEKIIDSNCGDWSSWIPLYNKYESCPDTKLFAAEKRTRICSHGLNGGLQCSGNIFEERSKFPVLFESVQKNMSYDESQEFCRNRSFSLFTNIALLTANYSQFVSQENLTKLQDWRFFIDAIPTNENEFMIENNGDKDEYFAFCPALEIFTG